MDVTQSPTQNRPQRDGMFVNRRVFFLLILALVAAVSTIIGMWTALPGSSNDHGAAPATKIVKQDCAKPGNTVGALCASVTQEHGVVVTHTYVTQQYDYPANKFYNYKQGTSVQLNYGITATLDDLCRAGAVALTTPDHDYAYQYENFKREVCDYAQKAKSAGDADECYRLMDDQSVLAPLAFAPANIDDACAVPVQPKAKSALVDTGKFVSDTPWYNDPSASPSNN